VNKFDMTKIEEFEKRIIENGMTEADFVEYETLLRRVHDNFLKLQHCYHTAYSFPIKRTDQAVALIEWCLEKFSDDWYGTYASLLYIGMIRERNCQYQLAYDAYLRANEACKDHEHYHKYMAGNLMWVLLHIDNFTYSKHLEEYYDTFNTISDFDKAFSDNEFRLCVAETVIFSHYSKGEEAYRAYEKAMYISNPNYVSRIQGVLDRHRAKDVLHNTKECRNYLLHFSSKSKRKKHLSKGLQDSRKKPIRRFGEAAYILGIIMCSLGVCLSAKSGFGVSHVVAPAYVLSSFLEPIAPFFTFGNTEYIVQGVLLILLAAFMKRVTLSYPLSLVTAVIYGVTLDLWRMLFGTNIAEELYLRIILMLLGALLTGFSIAMMLRSYMPQQAYDFAVKEISVVKKVNMNKVKWIYDICSLFVALALMLILFHGFDLSLIGIGTLVLAVINAPMITLFGKILDKFVDFSPLFPRFASRIFKVDVDQSSDSENQAQQS